MCQCIASIYSLTATVFPLGIRMRLVPALQASITRNTCQMATTLQFLQANFLAGTETSKLYTQQPGQLNKSQLYASLWALLRKAIHPIKPMQQLIHAISLLVKQEEFLIYYLHQYRTLARAAIAQVPKQLPGLQMQSRSQIGHTTRAMKTQEGTAPCGIQEIIIKPSHPTNPTLVQSQNPKCFPKTLNHHSAD